MNFIEKTNLINTRKIDIEMFSSLIDGSILQGQLSNFGPLHQKLTQQLTRFLNLPSSHCLVLCNNGTAALTAAYHVSGIKKIIIPSYTFEATRCAAAIINMKQIICDVDIKTGILNCQEIEEILSSERQEDAGVVYVSPLGMPIDFEEVSYIKSKYNSPIIFDNAAGFGSFVDYADLDFVCYSFHATKTLAFGEGGAIVCKKKYYNKLLKFISFGFDKNKLVKPPFIAMNGKLSEYSCAVGLCELKNVNKIITDKQQFLKKIQEILPEALLQSTRDSNNVFSILPLFLSEKQKSKLVSILKQNGVQYAEYYKPLRGTRNSKYLYKSNICLPCYKKALPVIENCILQFLKSK